jgi:L-malate glycosyltransferase
MKVLILSDAQCIHTKRWVSSLMERGVEVILYSIKSPDDDFFSKRGVKAYYFDLFTYKRDGSGLWGSFKRHSAAVSDLKNVLRRERPDILHAHYATSYCLIAALSHFHPLIVSVWGSDVYDFPRESFVNKLSVKFIFKKADLILSTSHVMARESAKYTDKKIVITPFGVDTDLFRKVEEVAPARGKFVVGTVKTLAPKYGIDYLIRAFDEVVRRKPCVDLSLVIVGKGPAEGDLKSLVCSLGLEERVVFKGFVDNSLLPSVYSSFSVSVFLSVWNSESFGVAAVEAMACESAVVVSDADGFKEVVEDGVSGIIVPKYDYMKAADAIEKFIDNPSLCVFMGKQGRKRVQSLYEWDNNVGTMIDVYNQILSNNE